MMDNMAIVAADDFQPCGYPREAESLLICELDGTASEVDHLIERVSEIATKNNARRSASPTPRPSASSSGPGERTRFRPSARSAPITSAWTERSPARS